MVLPPRDTSQSLGSRPPALGLLRYGRGADSSSREWRPVCSVYSCAFLATLPLPALTNAPRDVSSPSNYPHIRLLLTREHHSSARGERKLAHSHSFTGLTPAAQSWSDGTVDEPTEDSATRPATLPCRRQSLAGSVPQETD